MVALPQAFVRNSAPAIARPLHRPRRVAVVLNANARKVDEGTLRWIRTVVPNEDLFLSRSLEELPAICDMVLARRYDAVLWGGGDGTLVQGVQRLIAAAEQQGVQLPEMGVLRLGTGNAVAETIGAADCSADGLALDLSRARTPARRKELSLLEVEGKPSVFCGFGMDAQILDDHHALVDGLKSVGLAKLIESANARYFLSVAGRSIPKFMVSARPEVVAINRGAPAIKIDTEGRQIGAAIPAGRVLWRGPLTLAGASTVPYYGLALKMFPHAQKRSDKFALRLSDVRAGEALMNLPKVWRGAYQGDHVHDFLADDVELMVSRPSPFQSGGDLVGERTRMRIKLSPTKLSMI